jgi:hypothetical protein
MGTEAIGQNSKKRIKITNHVAGVANGGKSEAVVHCRKAARLSVLIEPKDANEKQNNQKATAHQTCQGLMTVRLRLSIHSSVPETGTMASTSPLSTSA